jgi:hypothetical protein
MADTPIALDCLEALEIGADFATEVAFNQDLFLNDGLRDLIEGFLVQLMRPGIRVQAGVFDQAVSQGWPDTVNVPEREWDFFVPGNFDTQ